MKKFPPKFAIECSQTCSPIFGGNKSRLADLFIDEKPEESNCFINNDGLNEYECHPLYGSSLFVGTNKPDSINYFDLYDYEVYTFE